MSKFSPEQELYYVKETNIVPIKVVAVITRKTEKGETVSYEVQGINGQTRTISEAYLIEDFYKARETAQGNWESIVNKVVTNLNNLERTTYSIEKKKYDARIEEQKETNE